jgi:ABC-type phosphate/phosphonate transport system substrate-binding protein
MAKQAANTKPAPQDDPEVEVVVDDETPEAEGPKGMTTREVADMLGTTPQKLRRILRSEEFQNDHAYTRYALTDEDIEKLKAAIAAGAGTRKSSKKAAEEGEADQAPEELDADLTESDDDEEEVDELDLDEDDE